MEWGKLNHIPFTLLREPKELKFLPPLKKKKQTPVPASTMSTTTFSVVGFSKDMTVEEYSPMQALMVIASMRSGGTPDPVRWNILSPNWEWNVPLFITWWVRAARFSLFPTSCFHCSVSPLQVNFKFFFFLSSSCCYSKYCYLDINHFILGDVHNSFLYLISVLLQAHSI